MEYICQSLAKDLLSALQTQRKKRQLCDVTLVVGEDSIPAHRCVLAASSEYFRALFLGHFDKTSQNICQMATCESKALDDVVHYMYSGSIFINIDNVDSILQVADYLCLAEVRSFCCDLLRRHLDLTNCIQIKALTDQFSLDDIRGDVMDFLTPRMHDILKGQEVLCIPFEYVYPLLSDTELNYIRETDLLHFIFRWINHAPEERKQHTAQLIGVIDFSYLGSEYIMTNIINSKDISEVLLPHQKSTVHIKLSQQSYPSRMDDVIVCKSRRAKNPYGEVHLCVYMISEDRWYTVNCPEPHLLDGIESLACDHGALYLLLTRYEDMRGYVHNAKEHKQLWKLTLDRGEWSQMPSPNNLTGQSRLVPHVRGLYVIDRTGVIDKFDNMTNSWMQYNEVGFTDSPNATMYILPIDMDRYIYILRGFSEGHAFDYAQMSFSLHCYDTDRYTWKTLTHIEVGDLNLANYELFHDYTATTSLILRDALGSVRVKYDLKDGECTVVNPAITMPIFISEIWGCAGHQDRVYFTGRMSHDNPVFMLYDQGKKRFKMVAEPPVHISGLLCHMVVPRSFRKVLAATKGKRIGDAYKE